MKLKIFMSLWKFTLNYQNRLFTYLYNQRTDLINIFLLSLISIIIFKTVGGSPIIGIWEGNNIYNIFAAQYNSFNIFSISQEQILETMVMYYSFIKFS